MGTKKQEQLEQKTKRKKSALERKVERLQSVDGMFEKYWPSLWECYNDYELPLVEFRIYLKEGGDYLGLIKREVGVKDQILFTGADDFLECMDQLNNAVRKGAWKEERPRGSS